MYRSFRCRAHLPDQPETSQTLLAYNARHAIEMAIDLHEMRAMFLELHVLTIVLPSSAAQTRRELEDCAHRGFDEWCNFKRQLEDRYGRARSSVRYYTEKEIEETEAIWRQFAVDWTLLQLLRHTEHRRREF